MDGRRLVQAAGGPARRPGPGTGPHGPEDPGGGPLEPRCARPRQEHRDTAPCAGAEPRWDVVIGLCIAFQRRSELDGDVSSARTAVHYGRLALDVAPHPVARGKCWSDPCGAHLRLYALSGEGKRPPRRRAGHARGRGPPRRGRLGAAAAHSPPHLAPHRTGRSDGRSRTLERGGRSPPGHSRFTPPGRAVAWSFTMGC